MKPTTMSHIIPVGPVLSINGPFLGAKEKAMTVDFMNITCTGRLFPEWAMNLVLVSSCSSSWYFRVASKQRWYSPASQDSIPSHIMAWPGRCSLLEHTNRLRLWHEDPLHAARAWTARCMARHSCARACCTISNSRQPDRFAVISRVTGYSEWDNLGMICYPHRDSESGIISSWWTVCIVVTAIHKKQKLFVVNLWHAGFRNCIKRENGILEKRWRFLWDWPEAGVSCSEPVPSHHVLCFI